MATITGLKLEIKKGSSQSDVSISYNIHFTHCERVAGSTFLERVSLRGDDSPGNPDDHLTWIGSSCIKATKNVVARSFKRKVNNSVLDEDDFIFNRGDEVYARVSLTPFNPSSTTVDSNIISSNF